jgi:hypothetical protein
MEETFDKIGQDMSNENQGLPFLILNKKTSKYFSSP